MMRDRTHAMETEAPRTGLGNDLSGKHRQHIHTALGAPRPGHGLEQGLGQCSDLAAKSPGTDLLVRGLQLTSFHLTLRGGGPTAFTARAQYWEHHSKL